MSEDVIDLGDLPSNRMLVAALSRPPIGLAFKVQVLQRRPELRNVACWNCDKGALRYTIGLALRTAKARPGGPCYVEISRERPSG